MDVRRVAAAVFETLRAVAALGIVAGALALVVGLAVAYGAAATPCPTSSDLEACRDGRVGWMAWSAVGAGAGAMALGLFVPILIASGGPRRRGRKWAAAKAPDLLQARGWFAEGRVSSASFERVSERHRRHADGMTDGEAAWAGGASLTTAGVFAAVGATVCRIVAAALRPGDPVAPQVTTAYLVLFLVAAGGLVLGIPSWALGRRQARAAYASFDRELDQLAHEAAATAVVLLTKDGQTDLPTRPAAPAPKPRARRAAAPLK